MEPQAEQPRIIVLLEVYPETPVGRTGMRNLENQVCMGRRARPPMSADSKGVPGYPGKPPVAT